MNVRMKKENINTIKYANMPSRIYIETTNRCNARCIMCPHTRMKRINETMSETLFERVLQILSEADLSESILFMHKEGEPFLDSQIAERIQRVKSATNAKEIAINTNASLMNAELSRKLIYSGLDTLYISLDGTCAETYEKIRIGLNYKTVHDNIINLFKQMRENKSELKVILQMLTNKNNLEEVEVFRKIWSQYPCEIFIKSMHSYLDGGRSSLTARLTKKQKKTCSDPFEMLVIYVNGNVGCCCWDYDNEINIGTIWENSLEELFHNEIINKIRRLHTTFNCEDLTPCNRCMRAFGNDSISGISGVQKIKIL